MNKQTWREIGVKSRNSREKNEKNAGRSQMCPVGGQSQGPQLLDGLIVRNVPREGHAPGVSLRGHATDANCGRAILRTESRRMPSGSSGLNEILLVQLQNGKTGAHREKFPHQQVAQGSEIHAQAGSCLVTFSPRCKVQTDRCAVALDSMKVQGDLQMQMQL